MRIPSKSVLALALVIVACTQEEDMGLDLVVPSPVAVGATVNATVSGSGGRMDQPSVDDPNIFAIDGATSPEQRSTIQLRALREGKTTFRARGDNGKKIGTIKEDIEAATPNRIEVTSIAGCTAPYLIGAGATFTVSARRFKGTIELWGEGGVYAIESDVASNADGSNVFTGSSTRALGWVSSRLNSSKLRVEVFEASQVTAMKLGSTNPIKAGAEARLDSKLVVSGQSACRDDFTRDVAIATADVCESGDANHGGSVVIKGKKAGTCEVTVTLAGTSISAKSSFRVDEGSTTVPSTDAGTDASPSDAGIGDAESD